MPKSQDEIDAAVMRGLFRRWLEAMGATRDAWERQRSVGISRQNAETIADLTDGEIAVEDWPTVLPVLHLDMRALHNRSRKSRVNSMETDHRLAISKGMTPRNLFLRAVRKAGFTSRSLAKALGISPATLAAHRLPKADTNSRPIPTARAERIRDLTGWPADAAHWPAGLS